MIMTLLRMLEASEGQIVVDGRDISTIDRNVTRASINVIPQEPFLMPGSVRFNLDPQERITNSRMAWAIKRVGLWDRVNKNGGLDAEVGPDDWSIGEKQLLELARALLVKSPILVLDEAASK